MEIKTSNYANPTVKGKIDESQIVTHNGALVPAFNAEIAYTEEYINLGSDKPKLNDSFWLALGKAILPSNFTAVRSGYQRVMVKPNNNTQSALAAVCAEFGVSLELARIACQAVVAGLASNASRDHEAELTRLNDIFKTGMELLGTRLIKAQEIGDEDYIDTVQTALIKTRESYVKDKKVLEQAIRQKATFTANKNKASKISSDADSSASPATA